MPSDKEALIGEFAIHEKDTGSAQVQIALLTDRIQHLTDHLKEHKHDEHSRLGLLKLVGRRRRLLKYLSKKNPDTYRDVITKLGLRR
jgi:small subunit ribosomal protein S15